MEIEQTLPLGYRDGRADALGKIHRPLIAWPNWMPVRRAIHSRALD